MPLEAGSILIETNQPRVESQRHRLASLSTADRTQELNDAEAIIRLLKNNGKLADDLVPEDAVEAAEKLNAVGIVRIP
jgi:hypothetical protein